MAEHSPQKKAISASEWKITVKLEANRGENTFFCLDNLLVCGLYRNGPLIYGYQHLFSMFFSPFNFQDQLNRYKMYVYEVYVRVRLVNLLSKNDRLG